MQQRIIFLTIACLASLSAVQAQQQVKTTQLSRQEELAQQLSGDRAADELSFSAEEFAHKTLLKLYEQDHGKISDYQRFFGVKSIGAEFAKKVFAYFLQPHKSILALSPKLLLLLKKHGTMIDQAAFFGYGQRRLTIAATALGAETAWYLKFIDDEQDEEVLSTIIVHAEEILKGLANVFEETSVSEVIYSIEKYICVNLEPEESLPDSPEKEQNNGNGDESKANQ